MSEKTIFTKTIIRELLVPDSSDCSFFYINAFLDTWVVPSGTRPLAWCNATMGNVYSSLVLSCDSDTLRKYHQYVNQLKESKPLAKFQSEVAEAHLTHIASSVLLNFTKDPIVFFLREVRDDVLHTHTRARARV